jgi:hypothetical protein
LTGEINLSWINLKERYLFSVNVAIAAGLLIYLNNGSIYYFWISGLWLFGCIVSDRLNGLQFSLFKTLGRMNSTIILGLFYFLFFSPYSIFYRLFFKHSSFRKGTSFWIKKDQSCDFDRPF